MLNSYIQRQLAFHCKKEDCYCHFLTMSSEDQVPLLTLHFTNKRYIFMLNLLIACLNCFKWLLPLLVYRNFTFKFRGVASLCSKFPLQNADSKIYKQNKHIEK